MEATVNFFAYNVMFFVTALAATLISYMFKRLWDWEWRRRVHDAIERFKPLPEFPPDGSLWFQSTRGLTWMTQGYYDKETRPTYENRYDIRFVPGSMWLVLGSGVTEDPSHFYVDLLAAGETRPVRVMHNRCAMEHFSSVAKDMKRIDDID